MDNLERHSFSLPNHMWEQAMMILNLLATGEKQRQECRLEPPGQKTRQFGTGGKCLCPVVVWSGRMLWRKIDSCSVQLVAKEHIGILHRQLAHMLPPISSRARISQTIMRFRISFHQAHFGELHGHRQKRWKLCRIRQPEQSLCLV